MESSGSQSRPSNKNACPICGRDKTAWSEKCGTCEANRQRYLASVQRTEEDRLFLEEVARRGQTAIARETNVSRQAIHQRIKKARRRLDFLQANPLPPLPQTLIQQAQSQDRIPA